MIRYLAARTITSTGFEKVRSFDLTGMQSPLESCRGNIGLLRFSASGRMSSSPLGIRIMCCILPVIRFILIKKSRGPGLMESVFNNFGKVLISLYKTVIVTTPFYPKSYRRESRFGPATTIPATIRVLLPIIARMWPRSG